MFFLTALIRSEKLAAGLFVIIYKSVEPFFLLGIKFEALKYTLKFDLKLISVISLGNTQKW